MLDLKTLRDNPEAINQALKTRNPNLNVNAIVACDKQRLQLLQEEETLRNERNTLSKQVPQAKAAGQDPTPLLERGKAVGEAIKTLEAQKLALEEQQQHALLHTPNLPSPHTPVGPNEEHNVVLRHWGCEFKNRPATPTLPHWELGEQLGWLDFERAVKVAESRFGAFRGQGARLQQALIRLMLDVHTQLHGYEEVAPPYLVNEAAMTGTGQLPKFREDLYALKDDSLFLIPTAEVPITNLYRGEVLEASQLPLKMVAYTPCFRREAGSAGKDTRGLIRQHQFDKVELVNITSPSQSAAAHEALTAAAEKVLQLLELPYRVVELCTGDLGFSATRCYDLEVWMPAAGCYREISSCSNMGDFQARRMNLKVRDPELGDKPVLAHTLNGSGLAVGRTLAALLENYQTAEGTIALPAVLAPYLQTGAHLH
jgi:seryl-tRNA synthetase